MNEVTTLQATTTRPSQLPVISISSLLDRELGSWTNHWVHVNGLVLSYQAGQFLVVKDPTGVIRAHVIQMTEIRGDERVDIWGFLEVSPQETFLNQAYFEVPQSSPRQIAISASEAPASRSSRVAEVLTQVSDI